MSPVSKTRIYKSCIRPVIAYGAEARVDTVLTQLLRTTEMRIVRTIHGKTLRDRIYNEELRKRSGIEDIVEWVHDRRPNMLKGCLTTVSRRSFCITVQEGREAGADQRKDGRNATTPKAETNWMNRHLCLFKRLRRRRRLLD